MLERTREIPVEKFVGIRAHVWVEDYARNRVVRESPEFATYEEAEAFYDEVMDHKKQDEALKYLISTSDYFDRIELIEYTKEGNQFLLGKIYG